jgi:NitT/TauT family transport system permease protein
MKREAWIRLLVVAVFAISVEILCRTKAIPPTVLIPPSDMLIELVAILRSGELTGDIVSTFGNILIATLIVAVLGFAAGVIIHAMPWLRTSVEPLLASYYAVPTFMFYPAFIVLLGVGSAPIIAIAVLLAIVAMITATLDGLDRIPGVLRKTARMYHLSRLRTSVLIELPAASPYLFTGVKLAVAYSFIGVIASEFILSGSGLGYAIAYAYNNFENRKMYALMLLVLVAATAVNSALNAVDSRLQARQLR